MSEDAYGYDLTYYVNEIERARNRISYGADDGCWPRAELEDALLDLDDAVRKLRSAA